MMTISVDGGEPKPARYVIVYDEGNPVVALKDHGGSVVFADAVRDRADLVNLLVESGEKKMPVHKFGGNIKGNM